MMLSKLTELVQAAEPTCNGISDNGDGTYLVSFDDGRTRQATAREISDAADAEAQATQDKAALDTMRSQVRSALSALNTIQGAASFTNAQRDAAIKEMAQIVERFIRVVMEQAR